MFICFGGLAVVCDQALVPALGRFSKRFGLTHETASATILALGVSCSELVVSALGVTRKGRALIETNAGMLGSCLVAFTLVPAMCVAGTAAGDDILHLRWEPLVRDVLACSVLVVFLIWIAGDLRIDAVESAGLVVAYVTYVVFLLMRAKFVKDRMRSSRRDLIGQGGKRVGYDAVSFVEEHKYADESSEATEKTEETKEFEVHRIDDDDSDSDDDDDAEWIPLWFAQWFPPFGMSERQVKEGYASILLVSFLYVAVLSEICLLLCQQLAFATSISDNIVGTIFIGVGTQIDDLVASFTLAKHGRASSSISHALGSTMLNLGIGLGGPFWVSNVVRGQPVQISQTFARQAFMVFLVIFAFFFLASRRCGSQPRLGRVDAVILILLFSINAIMTEWSPNLNLLSMINEYGAGATASPNVTG